MKYQLLSSVCSVALIAAAGPAFADDTFSGVVMLDYGLGSISGSNIGVAETLDDPQHISGKAKGYWPLSPNLHVQGDLFYEQSDDIAADGGEWGSSGDATTIGGALHLLHPFENRGRFGGAVSIWNNDIYVPDGDGKTDKTYGLVAAEGQFFGSDWTLTGQAGYFGTLECSDYCIGSLDEGSYVRGKIRYFLRDNTSVSLETLQLWGHIDDEDGGIFEGKSTKFSKWKLEAEHRFEASQFSGILGVSHESTESGSIFSSSADQDTVWVGVRFYYNQDTLRSHDKSGAELDTPTFGDAPETQGILSYLYGAL